MTSVLFTNVRILDGTGAQPYRGRGAGPGQPHRARRPRAARSLPGRRRRRSSTAPGATLMPGMVEAHTHFSWNDAASLCRHPAHAARGARALVGQRGQALPRGRLDLLRGRGLRQAAARRGDAQRDQRGPDPGAALPRGQPGDHGGWAALGDETLPHLPVPGVQLRRGGERARGDAASAVRMFLKYGVDSIKLNLSGDNFMPSAPADTTWMSDEEVAVAVKEAQMRGKRVAAHARSCESIKQCVRHGIEIIYHASFTDEEALDMLEANRDRHFVAPGIGILDRHARARGALGHHRARRRSRWATRSSWRRRPSRSGRCTSAASACCPAATTASRSRRTARTPATSSTSSSTSGMTPMEAMLVGDPLRRRDHDDGRRAGPGQGRLPRRPPAGRRRPAREPRDPARPGEAARGHEGRRVLQGARDPLGASRAGAARWPDARQCRASGAGSGACVLGVPAAGVRRLGARRQRRSSSSRPR